MSGPLNGPSQEEKARRLLAVRAFVAPGAADVFAEFLKEYGAHGVAVVDPDEIRAAIASPDSLDYAGADFVAALGDKAEVTGWFDGDETKIDVFEPQPFAAAAAGRTISLERSDFRRQLEVRLAALDAFFPGTAGPVEISVIREEDWAEAWKRYYDIVHLGRSIVICPSWLDYEAKQGEHVLRLDPGMAFGTGTHETTALCAEMLEQLLRPGDTLLDAGTGSGILALIGRKLGASRVVAFDVDPAAVKTAAENAEANGLDIELRHASIDDIAGSFDLVVANIVFDVLGAIAGALLERTAPDGYFIASGVLAERGDEFAAVMEAAGFVLATSARRGDWAAFCFRRRR